MMRIRVGILVLLGWALAAMPVRPAVADEVTPYRREVVRVQRHLRTVEAALRQRDSRHLTPAQRAARTRALNNLRTYYQAGIFPRNEQFPGRCVPSFRDGHGTLCAMAYLIAKAGGPSLVDRVARTNNHAYVRDLIADPELRYWLWTNGITAAEAAWIQPAYPFYGNSRVDDELRARTVATTALSGISIYNNLKTPRSRHQARIQGALGLAVGLGTLNLGLSTLDDSDGRRTLGRYNSNIGLLTAAFGLKTLLFGGKTDRVGQAQSLTTRRGWEITSLTAPDAVQIKAAYRF